MIDKSKIFDECVKEAISLGRKYMLDYIIEDDPNPTIQEWDLALVLFANKLRENE